MPLGARRGAINEGRWIFHGVRIMELTCSSVTSKDTQFVAHAWCTSALRSREGTSLSGGERHCRVAYLLQYQLGRHNLKVRICDAAPDGY